MPSRTKSVVHLPALLSEGFGISRSEARRVIAQGGVAINGQTVTDLDVELSNLDRSTVVMGRNHVADFWPQAAESLPRERRDEQ